MTRRRIFYASLTMVILVLYICLATTASAAGLWVSVTTDKSSYNIGDMVGLSGTGSFISPKGTVYAYFEIFNPNGEKMYYGSYPISSDNTWKKPIGYTIQQNSVLGTYMVEARAIEYDSNGNFVAQSAITTITFEVMDGGEPSYTILHVTVKELDTYKTISGSVVSLNGVNKGYTDSNGNIDLQVNTNAKYIILASKTNFNSRSMTEFIYSDEKSVTIYLTPIDDPIDPKAVAGQDQIVDEGTVVTLSAASSYDPDGSIVSYEWKENGVILSNAISFNNVFPVGLHEITLKIIDNSGAIDTDTIYIKVDPLTCGNVNLFSYITVGGSEDNNIKVNRLTFSNVNPSPGETITAYIEWSGLDCPSCVVKTDVFGNWDLSNAIAEFYSGSNRGGSATINITMPNREDTYNLRFIWAFDIGSYSDYFGDNLPSEAQCNAWGDSKTVTLDKIITVSDIIAPPIPSFTHTTSALSAQFNSTSYDSDGTITTHLWNFGDGTTANTQNPAHTYPIEGNYTVTLTVTDNDTHATSTSETVTIDTNTITSVIHPSDIPYGTDLTVTVNTNMATDVTLDLTTYRQTQNGTDITFNIDTSTLSQGEHTLYVTAGLDSYTGTIIVYDPAVYMTITKGLDELETTSKDEMLQISLITGHVLTNHVYSVVMEMEVHKTDGEPVTVRGMLDNFRSTLSDISSQVTEQLEAFKNSLLSIDSTIGTQFSEMDMVIHSINNIEREIGTFNNQFTDENLVITINNYVTKPAIYTILCADEANLISTRTQITKNTLNPYYTTGQMNEVNEIILIGKQAIDNTEGEQIYRLDMGNIYGHEISAKPTLNYFASNQFLSLNPPVEMDFWGMPIQGKYNPYWVWEMTLADAQSMLTVPAYIGWIDATPEDERMISSPGVSKIIDPISLSAMAIEKYVAYADGIEQVSPWILDGGMIISTDLLSKEINEEHTDVITAISTILSPPTYAIPSPTVAGNNLSVPKGNILVTTSPDGKIRKFKYIESDSTLTIPNKHRIVSLNTGWSHKVEAIPYDISVTVKPDKSSYSIGETANLTINISSNAAIDSAMLWLFIPEANTTIKDILSVPIGQTSVDYNFTIQNETWHVPRVIFSDFDTILADNYTSFGVGTGTREAGVISIDRNQFYSPGAVMMNITVYNTGNTLIDTVLEYTGSESTLTGSVDIPPLNIGQSTTTQLTFDVTTPDVYEIAFNLNSSIDSTLDYNIARFTVTAIDTLLAYPSTDKQIYATTEAVNIDVDIKNVTLNTVSFPYSLEIISPSGNVVSSSSFTPAYNGTYIVKATPIADGYSVVEGDSLFIVEKQSDLVIESSVSGNITNITIKTDVGGVVEDAQVVVNGYAFKSDENGKVVFLSYNETKLFIKAEKFGFNPAISFVASMEPADTLTGDVNGDGILSSVDALMALQMSAGNIAEDLAADVSGDGSVTSLDALMILQASVGAIVL